MSKNGVKTVLSIGAFFLGAGGLNFFGAANAGLMGGMMGMSLMNTIWAATHKPSYDYDSTLNSRFDQMMNTVSAESMIPVIYGKRKWAGNQLWHKVDKEGRSLVKDVLVGEGTCHGVSDVKFNDIFVSGSGVMTVRRTFTTLGDRPSVGKATLSKTDTKITLKSSVQSGLSPAVDGEMAITPTTPIADIVAWINSVQPINILGTRYIAVVIDKSATAKDIANAEDIDCNGFDAAIGNNASRPLPGCSVEFHDGSVDQAPPDNHEVVGGYRRMAWLRCKMTISEQLQGNNPTVTYVVKGIKVLDTRTGVTEWSDNPAMCVRDFLLSKRYGISKFFPGMVLDELSFKEVADYCDQLVNYYDSTGILHQEKRYTMNIILDQKRKALEHLESMFACFGGYLVNNNGVISLRIEKPETSSYHFTNDTIVENSFNIEQLGLDETPNQYKIGYFDESQNWTQVKALAEDIIDQQPKPTGKGKVIVKELTLDGCTSQSQALRLGRLYRLKNKLCTLTATWKTTTFAMHLQCGDVVTMTYSKVDDDGTEHQIFTDKAWRIIEISEQDGVWSIKAREYNASIYGDVTETVTDKDYTGIGGNNVPPRITNVQAYTNVDDEILVTHDPSTDINFAEYRYYIEEVEMP